MDDTNRASVDAPFWWTLTTKLKALTLSSADALWLKDVREGGRLVARTATSDSLVLAGLPVEDRTKLPVTILNHVVVSNKYYY